MKIRKPTPEEKRSYDGIYPLYGFVNIGKIECPVEYLGEGPDNPNYEVLAPTGFQFENGLHTLLAENLKDLSNRLSGYSELEPDSEVEGLSLLRSEVKS